MSRFENLCIQCLMGLLLMMVIGGCAPGSAGSGTGPASNEPPGVAGMPPGVGPSMSPALPIVPGANLITGLTFNNIDLLGQWIDVATGTTIAITNQSITVKRSCRQFLFEGTWVASDALAIQLSGNLTTQASVSLGTVAAVDPASLVLALPAANQLYVEVIRNTGDSVFRLPAMVRLSNGTGVVNSCTP
jgi:hypothetical protein